MVGRLAGWFCTNVGSAQLEKYQQMKLLPTEEEQVEEIQVEEKGEGNSVP